MDDFLHNAKDLIRCHVRAPRYSREGQESTVNPDCFSRSWIREFISSSNGVMRINLFELMACSAAVAARMGVVAGIVMASVIFFSISGLRTVSGAPVMIKPSIR